MPEKQTKSLTELSETELAQKHLEPSTPEEIAASTENVIAMLEEPLKAAREERAALEAEKAEQFEYNRTLLEFAAFDILPDNEVSRFC
ncbi:hypothetical protein FACS18942_10550 [Planctomycetales bacterium]|nr:hypothetical protein FACS18942_10550 [Planctomycetales bacterium]